MKGTAKAVEKFKGIPIPEKVFDYLFVDSRKVEDVFRYLEDVFEEIVNSGYKPIFVLDEMQSIKEVINASGRPVISELLNFMVRLTKETHLCHSLCATSDCLFIEDVNANARLEGRARYILVDDLNREESFRAYEEFGFENKELIWDYIAGKIGDMVRLYEMIKEGYGEEEALKEMVKDERGKLKWMLRMLEEGEKEGPPVEEIKKVFELFIGEELIEEEKIKGKVLKFLIEKNVLFYNPLESTVRLQSRLLRHAIRELVQEIVNNESKYKTI